jgi:hypothetical protein
MWKLALRFQIADSLKIRLISKKNYTVTSLNVAFLKIVLSCFVGG